MYNPTVLGSSAGGVAGVGTLAYTGLDSAYYVVAAATLVFLGCALLRLIPRRES
ncbi:MAG: hypothetical protein ACRCTR_07555 [Actinomycetota bacterium]